MIKMYNSQLDTFIKVADAGSFSKAAEILYISPTAIIKQINLLEERLGLILFLRTHRGLTLTEHGKSIYKDAKYIIEYSNKAVERAKSIEDSNIIKVGVSAMTPGDSIIELWSRVKEKAPNLKLKLIPFENTLENAKEILANMGRGIDIVAGIYDERLLKMAGCSAYCLEIIYLSCAVPLNHKLVNKEILSMKDLYNEKIMLVKSGNFEAMDELRVEIESKHPKIEIIDFDFYDLDVFNKAENNNTIIISMNKEFILHPLFKNIEIEWKFKTKYGILHSPKPDKSVLEFLKLIDILKNKK